MKIVLSFLLTFFATTAQAVDIKLIQIIHVSREKAILEGAVPLHRFYFSIRM
ncbi:MAG: hypothetical protein GY765_30395 [bacterium]|nr:hypothetical protein [bacterium]